eukprot:gb/GFBE01026425.1/.p1 GENE.gb/GFBE01026425.1/~~gb/GFBE01026425.1/.p1  ORF type:complete len:205 (+),score=38.57 gb/GFBE01026425.1/:1-615(+)
MASMALAVALFEWQLSAALAVTADSWLPAQAQEGLETCFLQLGVATSEQANGTTGRQLSMAKLDPANVTTEVQPPRASLPGNLHAREPVQKISNAQRPGLGQKSELPAEDNSTATTGAAPPAVPPAAAHAAPLAAVARHCTKLFGLPKLAWAILCTLLGVGMLILCIPFLLTCTRRRPVGSPLFDINCGGPRPPEKAWTPKSAE